MASLVLMRAHKKVPLAFLICRLEHNCNILKYILYVKKRRMVKGITVVYRMTKNLFFLYVARMDILKFDQNLTFSEIILMVDQSSWMQIPRQNESI